MKHRLLLAVLALASCGRRPEGPPIPSPTVLSATPVATPRPAAAPEPLDFKVLSRFEYREHMDLPSDVKFWNGRRVEVTGFLNPTRQARDIKEFFLVKDRSACCYGARPQLNHFIDVTLKGGKGISYATDAITVVGTLMVEDRWDGDWPMGLYWIEDGEVVR